MALKVMVSGGPTTLIAWLAVTMRGSPIWVIMRVPATLTVRVSAVTLLAVAAFEITMVVPVAETTVVPAGMPVPEISWPAVTPVRLDTPVMDELPELTMPVGVTVLAATVAVALADITMVVPVAETTMAPAGMPVPAISWPAVTPVMLGTAEMVALPEVTLPVVVRTLAVEEEEAVA
jgi:hypothetical protein